MKQLFQVTLVSVLLLATIRPAYADAETEALKKEIKSLEARLDQLEKREQARRQTEAAALQPSAGRRKNTNIEQRLAAVEQAQTAEPSVTFTPGKGVSIASPDRQYALRLGAYVQADNRTFSGHPTAGSDTFLVRSARPTIEAKLTDYFDTRLQMDFGRGATTLLDAYGDFHPMPGNPLINLRAGEFKVPVGLERWQGETDVLFVERGQTTNLVPYRDIGVMAYGQPVPSLLEYQLALLNGAADLQANTGDSDNSKDVAGRIFVHPLAKAGVKALEGVGLGIGGTYGVHKGSTAAPGLTTGYVSFGQQKYFTFGAGTYADGPQWRLNPQATYYNGPLGLLAEYVLNGQKVKNGAHEADLRNDAWLGIGEVVLTGEKASFDGVTPAHDFDPQAGHWGAFELVGRVSRLGVDDDAFSHFASAAASARSAFETTGGITWFFSRAAKINLDFSRTTFDGGATVGDRPEENVVFSRLQLRF